MTEKQEKNACNTAEKEPSVPGKRQEHIPAAYLRKK
jgi:hypothetical protein